MNSQWKPKDPAEFRVLFEKGFSNKQLCDKFMIDNNSILAYISIEQEKGTLPIRFDFLEKPTGVTSPQDLDRKLEKILKAHSLARTIDDLANDLDVSPNRIQEAVERLKLGGHLLEVNQNVVIPQSANSYSNTEYYQDYNCGTTHKFGVLADTHLCNKYADMEFLNSVYNIFSESGVKDVYLCGNWIEGEAPFNKNEVTVFGMENQFRYFIENYPSRQGITTHILDGNDHEGWYNRRESILPGKTMCLYAKECGRNDLTYLGYQVADVLIQAPNGHTRMRIEHPGGGSTKVVSSKLQSIIDTLPYGNYPDIYLMGHYHKQCYLHHRGIHAMFVPSTCAQTSFSYNKTISSVIGAYIIEFTQADNGSILEFDHRYLTRGDDKPWSYRQ